jgi:CPA1 family monovalent cation:H+ antiporter
MNRFETMAVLLAAVVVLAGLARAIGVADPIVLLLGGLALGFLPGAPSPDLDPDVVFFVFLPPLLYSAAYLATGPDLREHALSLGTLAIGLVLATACAVAVVAHFAAGLPWAVAFVLGAVLGPTDPVSATAIVRRVGAPRRIETLLEGEALINDGTGLTAYTVAVGVVGAGTFSLLSSVGEFVLVATGGVAIGAATGWMASAVRRRSADANLEIAIALLTAYAAYILGDRAGTSGILAAVAAGIVVQRRSEARSAPSARLRSQSFWELVTFLLNAVLFLLVGLQFSDVIDGIEGRDAVTLAGAAAAVAGVIIALRLAWMLTMTPFVARATEDDQPPQRATVRREQLVMGWCGMRGALSLAAALAIPLQATGGGPFPARSLVIFLTYTTILLTLVPAALSLPVLLRRLGLAETGARRRETIEARRRLAHAALEQLEALAGDDSLPEATVNRLRGIHEARLERLESQLGDDDDERAHRTGDERRARQELLAAQRRELAELRGGGLPADTARELLRELDLEESRLSG